MSTDEIPQEWRKAGRDALTKHGVVAQYPVGDVLHDYDWTVAEAVDAVLAAVLPFIRSADEKHAAAMNSLAAEIHRERNRALTAAVDALRSHDDGIAHELGYTTGWDEATDFIAAMRLREAAHR